MRLSEFSGDCTSPLSNLMGGLERGVAPANSGRWSTTRQIPSAYGRPHGAWKCLRWCSGSAREGRRFRGVHRRHHPHRRRMRRPFDSDTQALEICQMAAFCQQWVSCILLLSRRQEIVLNPSGNSGVLAVSEEADAAVSQACRTRAVGGKTMSFTRC